MRNRKSLTRLNSFLNGEWGRVKKKGKRRTSHRRRLQSKKLLRLELEQL